MCISGINTSTKAEGGALSLVSSAARRPAAGLPCRPHTYVQSSKQDCKVVLENSAEANSLEMTVGQFFRSPNEGCRHVGQDWIFTSDLLQSSSSNSDEMLVTSSIVTLCQQATVGEGAAVPKSD